MIEWLSGDLQNISKKNHGNNHNERATKGTGEFNANNMITLLSIDIYFRNLILINKEVHKSPSNYHKFHIAGIFPDSPPNVHSEDGGGGVENGGE